jgi:hypothetical protein
MKTSRFLIQSAVLVGILVTLFMISRCGSSTSVDPTFTSLYSNYFKSCGVTECHAQGSTVYDNSVKLDMSTQAAAYAGLKAALDNTSKPECNQKPIASTTPDDTMLIAILDQSTQDAYFTATTCKPRYIENMKAGLAPSAEVLSAVRTWITNGATE